jgi:hypothetical protein
MTSFLHKIVMRLFVMGLFLAFLLHVPAQDLFSRDASHYDYDATAPLNVEEV